MAIAFDAVTPDTSSGAGTTSLTSGSWTVAAGAGIAIGVIGTGDSTNTTHSHSKFGGSGGSDLTNISSLAIGTHGRVSAWYLGSPGSGATTAFGDWGANQGEATIGMLTYTGASGTVGSPVTGSWNTDASGLASPSVSVTTTTGDLVVAVFFAHNTTSPTNPTVTASGGATTRYDVPGTAIGGFGAILVTELVASGASTTMSASVASADVNITNHGGIIAFVVTAGTPSSLEQEGFRGRNDDGSETTATWIASQDTNFTGPLDANTRIRFLINAGGDPAAFAYQLEYKLHADSVYIKAEPNGAGALATGTAGTTGTGGTTTCNVPYPATPAKGDMLIAVVGNRPNANTPDDIANWTKVTSTGGAGSEGAGTGTIRNTIYYKESLGTETGNLAVACTSGTSMFGTMFKYSKTTGKKWSVAVVHGPDNSAGTGWSATAASDPGLAANDFLICASINSEDTARAASEAVTATGCTFGSMSEKHDAGVTTGNDLSMVVADFPVSTGPSSAAPVYTMTMSGTNSANSAGCTAFIRIRQVDQPIQISTSGNIAAGGEATTALLTAPSGKSTSDFDTGRMWDDENGTDTIDITIDNYTEVEWCVKALSSGGAANADVYDLRVTKAGTALDTYTVSTEWTIGASDVSTGLGGSAVTMGAGTQGPGIAVPL